MELNNKEQLENVRVEYTALRAEILQADNICLLMMGYLVAGFGLLYSVQLEWLVSLLAFISLCYFTEKRFSIRKIAFFVSNEVCKDNSGFRWEKYVQELRTQGKLRPFAVLRPYNAELIICCFIAISPIFNGILTELSLLNANAIFWFLFAFFTVVLSIVNATKYNQI
ncbi:hypothetical protein C7293_30350 [filamentous cyanobacterium CCT1]|nr:hypothetical protein C7293_30350 [filamentous cyanobacterium CCT1]PSN76410.1 hypothetical protein C8B47_27475 [filamentous cyanobacterium CCP4]